MRRRRRVGREGLTVLLPLVEDGEAALKAVLSDLGRDAQSPFARIESTHFARLLHVAELDSLLFAAEFDIPVRGFLEALCGCMPDEADRIFEPCVGYPTAARPPAVAGWLLDHRLRAGFSLHGNPGATVSEVRRSLELRERIIAFALQTRGLDPGALARRWREEPWHEPPPAPPRPAPASGPGARRAPVARPPERDPPAPGLRLADVQGNILRGYGRRFAHGLFVFLRLPEEVEPVVARRWVAGLLDQVTTAAPWPRPPSSTLNVAFSHAGLERLGLPAHALEGFAPAFREGMETRSALLGDEGASAPARWEPGLRAADVLLAVTAADPFVLQGVRERVLADARRAGLDIAHVQPAAFLPGSREPFGFRDGLSEPKVSGLHAGRRSRRGAVLPGEFLLGHRDEGGSVPPHPELGRNGSYMVVRKLEQDVEGFWRAIREEAGPDRGRQEWLAARFVGRWRDGTPLVVSPDTAGPDVPGRSGAGNDFGYADDPDGARCPIGAHVRRMNPRDSIDARGRLSRRHLIIRRGMPYPPDEAGGKPGLMFVCFQASIERQFEFIQSQWANDGNAFGLGDDPDPLIGPGTGKFTIEGRPPSLLAPPGVVTTRGGGYFLAPGVTALRRLAAEPA